MTVSSFEDDTVASKGGQGGASFSAITAITSKLLWNGFTFPVADTVDSSHCCSCDQTSGSVF